MIRQQTPHADPCRVGTLWSPRHASASFFSWASRPASQSPRGEDPSKRRNTSARRMPPQTPSDPRAPPARNERVGRLPSPRSPRRCGTDLGSRVPQRRGGGFRRTAHHLARSPSAHLVATFATPVAPPPPRHGLSATSRLRRFLARTLCHVLRHDSFAAIPGHAHTLGKGPGGRLSPAWGLWLWLLNAHIPPVTPATHTGRFSSTKCLPRPPTACRVRRASLVPP